MQQEAFSVRVLSYSEAAERAGIVRRSLERLISNGEGPAIIHLSTRRRGILEADLEKWLLSRRHTASAEQAEQEGPVEGRR